MSNNYKLLRLISLYIGIWIFSILGTSTNLIASNSSLDIQVYAGQDAVICFGDVMWIDNIGAYIAGDVSDGVWFTQGDGYFMPGGQNSGVFSQTDQYIPGPGDVAFGSFTLVLVSDDPDGPGPGIQVSDATTCIFQQNPPMACNTNIALSLGEDCADTPDLNVLLFNPIPPYDFYSVTFTDENGNEIPDGIITGEYVGQHINFSVSYLCNGNSCWGTIYVEDKLMPPFICEEKYVDCDESIAPEDIGYPLPWDVTINDNGDGTYTVLNFDKCGDVLMTYEDDWSSLICNGEVSQQVIRTWTGTDESGNTAICEQIINLRQLDIHELKLPGNYNDIDLPAFECSDIWPAFENGHPSTDTTGIPYIGYCTYIQYNFNDIRFDECGSTFKVLREWLLVDWCTAESYTHNQIIKVLDRNGPEFECPPDLTVGTHPYGCYSNRIYLPMPDEVEDCSEYWLNITVTNKENGDSQTIYHEQGNNYYVDNLPVGVYDVTLNYVDDCENENNCEYWLTVKDDTPPIAVCDEHTAVALGANGVARLYAESLDDGSYDNCEIVLYEIAKMADSCGVGLEFGPYADFCCAETGQMMMVSLRVTDANGLSNTCMVEVEVEEKLPPYIECPPDLTISCQGFIDTLDLSYYGTVRDDIADVEYIFIDDGINSGIVGTDGYIVDNCGASVEEFVYTDLHCFKGWIKRKFVVTDMYGQVDSCFQHLKVIDPDPFKYDDITWPADVTMDGCEDAMFDVSVAGQPSYINEKCTSLGATYEDHVFEFVEDACQKILREWTVLDWCQYNQDNSTGVWYYTQTLKLENLEGPTLLENCQDTVVCIYGDNCDGLVTLTQSATDDCTPAGDLRWAWHFDIDYDGIYELTGTDSVFSEVLEPGLYAILWRVEDGCGNVTSCKYDVVVEDCKSPVPYCISFLTTVLMNNNGEVTVWARDFDYGSYDNCTAVEDLTISFVENPDSPDDYYVTYTCDSLHNGIAQSFPLEIWVRDEAGNQDFCEVVVTIQDNSDVCPDEHPAGLISGLIQTPNNRNVDGANLDLIGSLEGYTYSTNSNNSGNYSFENIPRFLYYDMNAHRDGPAGEGLSTLDMLQIQRHILGLTTFTDPYKIIAADINQSNSVTAIDLVQLRKVILGILTEFPENDSWKLINPNQPFLDPMAPWDYTESYEFVPLMDNELGADFTAVKIGDVNYSYQPENFHSTEERGRDNVDLVLIPISRENNSNKYILELNSEELLNGFQFALEFPKNVELVEVKPISEQIQNDHYAVNTFDDGLLVVSWSDISSFDLNSGAALFEITLNTTDNTEIKLNEEYMKAEVYGNNGILDISLEAAEGEQTYNSLYLYQAEPNPFSEQTVVRFYSPEQQDITIRIYDIHMNEIYLNTSRFTTGEHIIKLNADLFKFPGMYFVELNNGKTKQVNSVLYIDY